jgi:hypothetical protein
MLLLVLFFTAILILVIVFFPTNKQPTFRTLDPTSHHETVEHQETNSPFVPETAVRTVNILVAVLVLLLVLVIIILSSVG